MFFILVVFLIHSRGSPLITRVKVTRNYQVTVPAEARRRLGIREGDILVVEVREGEIVYRPFRPRLPQVKLGRRITVEDIEAAVEEALEGDV